MVESFLKWVGVGRSQARPPIMDLVRNGEASSLDRLRDHRTLFDLFDPGP